MMMQHLTIKLIATFPTRPSIKIKTSIEIHSYIEIALLLDPAGGFIKLKKKYFFSSKHTLAFYFWPMISIVVPINPTLCRTSIL